jgi:tRNA threonylcarbamoyladenosine biosynthesis protein TsaE
MEIDLLICVSAQPAYYHSCLLLAIKLPFHFRYLPSMIEKLLYYLLMEYVFHSESTAATSALGKKIGKYLAAGAVIALVGELGCGKTLLTRAICAGLRVPQRQVNSPTFVLVNEYHGRLPVFHIDLFRIGDEADGVELGIADYLRCAASGVMIIEWAEKILPLLPADLLKVEFQILSAWQRRIALSSTDKKFNGLFQELGKL